MKKYTGELALVGVSLFWGMGYAVIEYALKKGVSPLEIQALRFLIASICLLPLVLRRPQGFSKKTLRRGTILGIFMFGFFYLLLEGQRLTNTSKTAFLTGTYVLFVPFIEWIYVKARPRPTSFLAAVFSVFGIGLMSEGGLGGLERGDFLLISGALLVGIHMVLSADYVKEERPLHLNMVQLSVTALISLVSLKFFEGGLKPMEVPSLMAIVYIGVVSTFIAYMLQTTGQKYTTASRASVLLSLEAPVGTFFGVMVYKDPLTPRMALGYLFIFLSLLISEGLLSSLVKRRP